MARQPIAPAADERRSRRRGYALAASAVLLFSTSPVLTRVAGTISSLEIAWWRLFLAALTVLVIATVSRHRVRWQPLVSRRFALYGLIIALHFFFYIASLSFTTVAHSLALVYTAPVFIALLSRVVLKEGLTPSRWLGVALGVIGAAVLAGVEPDIRPRALLGDALAIGSALTFAVYSVAGRSVRGRYPLYDYAAGVYAWGALWLTPLAVWAAPGSSYHLPALGAVVFLGIGPLGIGHTLYNAALRRVPATAVNLIATGEVFGGVLLSALFLAEYPTPVALAGGAIVLLGIGLVIR